jgi:tRNA G18 (ribose-2'-O)-methylase SpoU
MKTKVLSISSSENPTFKKLKSLLHSKGIKKENLILVAGTKIITEALQQKTLQPEIEICTGEKFNYDCEKKITLSKALFSELDVVGTHEALLVCKLPALPLPKLNGFSVLLPLGDPNNLGAAIRSCVGFGVDEIVLLKEACQPFSPKVIKASAGAVFKAPLRKGPSIHDLHAKNLLSLDLNGQLLTEFEWPSQPTQLLLGEEGLGIPKSLEVQKITVPTKNIESLNAAHSLSIALFHRLKARI